MTDSVIKWNAIFLVHADSNEGIGGSVLLSIWATSLVGREWIDALGVNLFDVFLMILNRKDLIPNFASLLRIILSVLCLRLLFLVL